MVSTVPMKKQQVTTKTLTLNSIQDEKEIFKLTLATAFAVAAGYGVYASQVENEMMSDIMLENVEALASGEVDIEAICMGSTGTCIVFSDGYKIDGRRVA